MAHLDKQKKENSKVFRPNIDTMRKNEELDYDSTAYLTMNALKTEFPAMSFDILNDKNISVQKRAKVRFPLETVFVAGSQAPTHQKNRVSLFRVTNIRKTKFDGGEVEHVTEDSDNSEKEITDPEITEKYFAHPGEVNRIRKMPQKQAVLCTMSADSNVYFWDAQKHLEAIYNKKEAKKSLIEADPIAVLDTHSSEGFALSWNQFEEGKIVTGDCNGKIKLSSIEAKTGISVINERFVGHSKSVEDLQWSHFNANTFGSCSVDRSVCFWDARADQKTPVMSGKNLHKKDINVMSWSPLKENFLATGSDDCSFKVWDLRKFETEYPIAYFKWHRKPITSIEWSFFEDTVLLASSEDNTLSIWDLSMEDDPDRKTKGAVLEQQVPPQLMFVHTGQKDIKEAHFHPDVKSLVLSTSLDGFHIFAPNNV